MAKREYDSDPTASIRKVQREIAREQGGTEFPGDSGAYEKHDSNNGVRGVKEALPENRSPNERDAYHTDGEYGMRNFGPEDNVTQDDNHSSNHYY